MEIESLELSKHTSTSKLLNASGLMALTTPLQSSAQDRYRDSPPPSPAPSPAPTGRTSPSKPLPPPPHEAQAPPQHEPYRDDPSAEHSPTPEVEAPRPQRYRASSARVERQVYFPPYSDAPPVSDDDVPLAHLYPYPTEAPPSYAAVVVQSYRDTLISHIPPNLNVTDVSDEEMGVERSEPDDVRFPIESAVAKLVVALILVSAVLVWHILHINGVL